MAKIFSFFNHKGGVGKTTLVHNIGELLSDKGYRVLLIDADPQMNLTAALYGISTNIDYSTDENSKWAENTQKYISLYEYLQEHLQDKSKSEKQFFKKKSQVNDKGFVDLISGSINLSELEANLYGIIKNRNSFTENIPYKFEQAFRSQKEYDFILIDTSPSSSSVINAIIVMSSDYIIAPVSPSFFSLQAIDNLSAIFNSWINLLGTYQTTHGFRGLSFKPKFLGIVVQMAKRYNGGAVQEDETKFTKSAEKWMSEVNTSIKRFQEYAMQRGLSIGEDEFRRYFNEDPFIIQKCCDFTPQLRSIAEKAGIPVVQITQEICNKYKDPQATVDISKENGQYTISLNSIKKSYNNIADGLIKMISKTAL